VTSLLNGKAMTSMSMTNRDEIFLASDCETVPQVDGAHSTAPMPLHSFNTTISKSQEVARGKPTAQSLVGDQNSVLDGLMGYPELAVDGNAVTSYMAGSCTHTTIQRDPWWQVDVAGGAVNQVMDLLAVEIWPRGDVKGTPGLDVYDSDYNTLDGFEVWFGNVSCLPAMGSCTIRSDFIASSVRCGGLHTSQPGRLFTLNCSAAGMGAAQGVRARYVTITIPGRYVKMSFCEVRVYEANIFDAHSAFVTTATSLSSTSTTTLKVCATTKEMRAYGELPTAGEFRELVDHYVVIDTPLLPSGFDTTIRSITETSPDFIVEGSVQGDFYYLSPTPCGSQTDLVPPIVSEYAPNTAAARLQHHRADRAGLMMVSYDILKAEGGGLSLHRSIGSGKLVSPQVPPLTDRSEELGYPAERKLYICYATKSSEGDVWEDYLALPQTLHIIPQPTGVLNPFQLRENIAQIFFNQPEGGGLPTTPPSPPVPPSNIAGQLGDIFILQRYNCVGVADKPFSLPFGPSGRVILQEGGVAGVHSIAGGMLNELELFDNYRICFATAESGGDTQTDFVDLFEFLMIRLDERAPRFDIDTTVPFGEDIVVRWHSNHGLDSRGAHTLDWVGLYRHGDCTEEQTFHDYGEFEERPLIKTKHASLHECYVAWVNLEDGATSGIARFSVAQYKHGGEFDVRYFLGDSRSGAGYVCRGLRQRTAGDYVHCVLHAKATSPPITVTADTAVSNSNMGQSLGATPGLEHHCDGPLCSY